MKKSIKILSLFIMSLALIIVGKETVFASDNAPSSFVAKSSPISKKPLGLTNNISVKKTSDGKYIYCYDVNEVVPNNITYTKKELITDPVINYIVGSGIYDKTENEFFATQAALWIYLLDTGKMKDTQYNYIANIKKAINKYPNDPISIDINNILTTAKSLGKYYMEDINITLSNVNLSLNSDGTKYVSDVIEVNKMINDYEVKVENAPQGTSVVQRANGFVVTVPVSSVKEGTTSFNVKVSFTKYNTYKYVPSDSKYQDMLTAYSYTSTDSVKVTIVKKVTPAPVPEPTPEPTPDKTVIVISKKDITNGEELPGATLVIRNSKGEVVETWVSTNEPKKFEKLPVGKYTLEETIAPEGYVLSKETISFEVKEDGKIVAKTMYNSPEETKETVVSISKKDITSKEELPGATLIIRDKNENEIARWVSSNEPYIIKGLEEGTYTLEEIQAPDGYKLSSEKITFEVKNNGVVTEVVMFNAPEATIVVPVPPTGSFASNIGYIIGGLVIIIGSVLIYRNVKKEQ